MPFPPMTILTPVFLDRPERWEYLLTTLRTFAACCRYPGPLVHKLLDDRSPAYQEELQVLCRERRIEYLGRVDSARRAGFADVYRRLLAAVPTEFFVYLEPDHYFYLPADFLGLAQRLFALEPDLVGIYLRAPMTANRFRRETAPGGDVLVTYDGTRLRRVGIDADNVGWVGRGHQHEGFTLMPAVWRTRPMQAYFLQERRTFLGQSPYDFELEVDQDWNQTRLVGYLNAQAFCYHIGAIGGLGGGYTTPGDASYESVWSSKIL